MALTLIRITNRINLKPNTIQTKVIPQPFTSVDEIAAAVEEALR